MACAVCAAALGGPALCQSSTHLAVCCSRSLCAQRAKHESVSRPLDPEVLENLRDFAKLSQFKRTALEAIAFSMSAQSIKHLREAFMRLDVDQSGFVSLPEFLEVVVSSGMTKEEALRVFEGIDQDRTNTISYTEFLAASLSRRLWLTRERIRDAFQRLDVDGTGYITAENLREVMGDDWSPEKVATMFREADAKGDGRIGETTGGRGGGGLRPLSSTAIRTDTAISPPPLPFVVCRQTLKSSWRS
jgi:Ca2+-binding EF-hand superfamily protein